MHVQNENDNITAVQDAVSDEFVMHAYTHFRHIDTMCLPSSALT